jgi:hypothetical protein
MQSLTNGTPLFWRCITLLVWYLLFLAFCSMTPKFHWTRTHGTPASIIVDLVDAYPHSVNHFWRSSINLIPCSWHENFEFSEKPYPGCIASAFVILQQQYLTFSDNLLDGPIQTAISKPNMQTFCISGRVNNHSFNAHFFTSSYYTVNFSLYLH